MLQMAQEERNRQQICNTTFVLGDLLHAPCPPHHFDFIGSDNALHDMPLAAALSALKRLVRPGGHLMLRDLVAHDSQRSQSTLYQMARSVRRAPAYVRRYGVQTAWRLLKFELHPTWLRHRARGVRLTPAAFETTYSEYFPGGRFVHYGWASALFWQAPPEA